MKISFVVPVYKSEDNLKNCLESLIDQKGADIEIVVVFDGESYKGEQILEDFRFKVHKEGLPIEIKSVTIEHAGACAARNAGFKASTGDIISFFNSDYFALPGMLQEWLEGFKDNPEADFIITGYGWMKDGQNYPMPPHMAEEFDPFVLTQYNYIDCGCPIKREAVVEWDVNCKSLQDWDFFIRVVQKGGKGALHKGVTYLAELPKAGGLSNDSHSNWIDRVKYVKDKNGIKQSEICVLSYGAATHAKRIAEMNGWDYNPLIGNKPHKYKLVYLIGCYTGPRDPQTRNQNWSNLQAFVNCSQDCIKIIHWVGADVYWLRQMTVAENEYLGPWINQSFIHLVESEAMKKEMATYHIETKIVPIAPPSEYKVLPLPEELTIAVMKTERSDFDKYCGDMMDGVMAALPMVKFKVFGDGKCKRPLPNVENCGYVKMDDFIPKCSAILRIVRHDGPMMANQQFIMAGRDSISNLDMPYTIYIDTTGDGLVEGSKLKNWDRFAAGLNIQNYPDTKKKIVKAILDLKDGKIGNKDREEASAYYRQLLDKEKYKTSIEGYLK